MVQHFTELALEIRSARISSDGGWFVDSFEICEADGGQVTNPRKLESIRRVRCPTPLAPPSSCVGVEVQATCAGCTARPE